MVRRATASAKNIEQAVDQACAQLGVARDMVDIKIISTPRKGIFGLFGTSLATVEVSYEEVTETAPPQSKPQPTPKPQRQQSSGKPTAETQGETKNRERKQPTPKPQQRQPQERRDTQKPDKSAQETAKQDKPTTPEAPKVYAPNPEKMAFAKNYLQNILKHMGAEVSIEVTQEENIITLKLTGDVAALTEWRGVDTIDALQYLTGLATNNSDREFMRIVIEAGDFRQQRQQELEELAKKQAAAVLETNRSVTLEPMNPYERRIIHATITDIEGVKSISVGEGSRRCVVISLLNAPPPEQSRGRGGRRPYGGGRKRYNNNRKPTGSAKPDTAPEGVAEGTSPTEEGTGDYKRSDDRGRRPRSGGKYQGGKRPPKPEPYKPTGQRSVAPTEADDIPLFGKVDTGEGEE